MTNAIVKQSQINTIDDLGRVAKMLALSSYFDAKGNSEQAIAQIATKILAGQEMGYGPFASVNGIHVIQGKPTLSANLMAAAVKAHPKYDYRVRQMDDTAVVIEFFENNESLGKSSFSMEDAKKAKTQNTDKFPRNMLFARAMSNGVRWYCPDVFNGSTVYTPEEFDVTVDSNTGAIINETTNGRHVDTTTGEIIESDVNELAASVNATVKVIKEDPALEKARKAFHAEVTGTFSGDADDARHWLIRTYTAKKTPDAVRESTNELTANELTDLAGALKAHRKTYQDRWIVEKTQPIAA